MVAGSPGIVLDDDVVVVQQLAAVVRSEVAKEPQGVLAALEALVWAVVPVDSARSDG